MRSRFCTLPTDDFFRSRPDQMVDFRHSLVVLAERIPWQAIEAALAPALAHKNRAGTRVDHVALFGPSVQLAGAGVSAAGRLRLSIRLVASLLRRHPGGATREDEQPIGAGSG